MLRLHHKLLIGHITSHHIVSLSDVVLGTVSGLTHGVDVCVVGRSILTILSTITKIVVSPSSLVISTQLLLLILKWILMTLRYRISLESLSSGWLTFPLPTWYSRCLLMRSTSSRVVSKRYLLSIIAFEKVVLSIGAYTRVFKVNHVSTLLHLIELLIIHIQISQLRITNRILLTLPKLVVFWTFFIATLVYVVRVIVMVLVVEAGLWNVPLLRSICIICRVANWSRIKSLMLTASVVKFPTVGVAVVSELDVVVDVVWQLARVLWLLLSIDLNVVFIFLICGSHYIIFLILARSTDVLTPLLWVRHLSRLTTIDSTSILMETSYTWTSRIDFILIPNVVNVTRGTEHHVMIVHGCLSTLPLVLILAPIGLRLVFVGAVLICLGRITHLWFGFVSISRCHFLQALNLSIYTTYMQIKNKG